MADTVVRMGRPPLKQEIKTRKTTLRLPEDLLHRIEASAGPNRMAEFFRDAAERELERREMEAQK